MSITSLDPRSNRVENNKIQLIQSRKQKYMERVPPGEEGERSIQTKKGKRDKQCLRNLSHLD